MILYKAHIDNSMSDNLNIVIHSKHYSPHSLPFSNFTDT